VIADRHQALPPSFQPSFLTLNVDDQEGTAGPIARVDPLDDVDMELAPPVFDHVIATLRSYKSLPPDWDGYGADAPAETAIEDAVRFVGTLPENLPPPIPMVSGSGEVGLFWKGGGAYVDVGFMGDGRVAYLAQYPGRPDVSAPDAPLHEPPGELLDILRQVPRDGA
jgi:hypothetical protein